MTRALAARLVPALLAHAMSDRYPTRALEYVLGWMMIVWSLNVIIPGNVMQGDVFQYFVALAPEWAWGLVGVLFSGQRLVALVRNGGWKPGPRSRAIGAAAGFYFWLALGVLYTMAVQSGAQDFPMRYDFFVLAIAELFCFARCWNEHMTYRASLMRAVPENGG